MAKPDIVVLIDGKMMAYRSHFSHRNLRTTEGQPTGMLHGFLYELLRINKKVPQAKIVVCWDGKAPTWRHRTFKKYKANRKKNPDFLLMASQTDILQEILKLMGFWVAVLDGVEADDMIGILSVWLAEKYRVRIYSSDRDMYQLVRENVLIWPGHKEETLSKNHIERWLGLPFEALMDIRVAAGDTGDNLKGIKGVGYKTAIKMYKDGFRVNDKKTWSDKHLVDWDRVGEEKKLAHIITDPIDPVWSNEQKDQLLSLCVDIRKRPGRNRVRAEELRSQIYKKLGFYELDELLGERHKFFAIP